MEQLINLFVIGIGCFSIGLQGVAWWKFQFFASRTRRVHVANQLSFFAGIVMMMALLGIIMQTPTEVSPVSVVAITAAIAELVAGKLIREDMAEKAQAVNVELNRINRLESQLRIMQREQ